MAKQRVTARQSAADEERVRAPEGGGSDGTGGTLAERPSPPSAATQPARRARVPKEAPVNAIHAGRKVKRASRLSIETPAPESTPQSSAAAAAGPKLTPTDSDPWTVPQSVRDRFVQDGNRFYFPSGEQAFKDQGRRLTTKSENTQVVRSLVEIAHSRGWTEVTVTGTDRFKEEAWRQARLEGLTVRGYRPTEAQQVQLIRALARRSAEPSDVIAAEPGPAAPAPAERPARAPDAARERIAGKLLEHGKDAYRHDPDQPPSYFIRIQTQDGPREVWGKDIERAVAKSLTQPKIGDEVVLARTGRDLVTVKRTERGEDGELHPKEIDVFRNRWVIEKKAFLEERSVAAEVVRNAAIAPREAVRQHPELAGTYLSLHAAELASRSLRDPEDRRRFVGQVRTALADGIERGEPLQPVRLRERAHRKPEVQPELTR